jgi:hypothetical protein
MCDLADSTLRSQVNHIRDETGPADTPGFRVLARIKDFAYALPHGHTARWNKKMARKPTARSEYVLFNVTYEDGTQRSNRRVPAELLGGIDGDEPARVLIEQQDREISERSGMPPLVIKRIVRVDDDIKERARDTRRAHERRASR